MTTAILIALLVALSPVILLAGAYYVVFFCALYNFANEAFFGGRKW